MKAALFFFALCAVATAETVTLTPVKDSDVYSYLDMTVGNSITLNVNASVGMQHSNHALIQFNLAALGMPANEIASAKLKIYSMLPGSEFGGSFRAGDIAIHRQGATWTETGLKWSHLQPLEKVAVMPVTQSNAWVEVDITSLVAQWVTTPASNFGLLMRPDAENVEPGMNAEFVGREVAAYSPQLIVTRGIPPATAPPVMAITNQGGQIIIEWPVTGSSGWTLQESDQPTSGWAATAATATQTNGVWRVVQTPGSSASRFFRLNKP
ncbi:DNRLRE domain-containing protein [Luteolibacter luteus]|uniref:DNRLRE domain-containing protein n=1 Tax=Luteolibacter luteus TaxID=2728835 RepID=A0A858RF14_9BACT|nr:DNRLRE domain-containing protein [Luteolibacter luteus]QJE95315.1 DNRLRE domain-containing protein [Luteolibacter luteus]